MIKKNKVLYIVTVIVVVLVAIITFYKIFILHDYLVSYQVSCNPDTESCFIVECDQETGDDCDNDDSEKYYKLVERKAFNAVKCPIDDSNCLMCQGNEIDCKVTLCDSSVGDTNCSSF